MEELEADPEYRAKVARLALQREAQWASWNEAAEPLLHDLRNVGLNISTLRDLGEAPAAAVPVLLAHVKRPEYADPIKDSILRSLASPAATPFWAELVLLLKDDASLSPAVRYLAAVALTAVASDERIGEIVELARDPGLGEHRVPLLLYLANSIRPVAVMALKELRADPILGRHAKALTRLARRQRKP